MALQGPDREPMVTHRDPTTRYRGGWEGWEVKSGPVPSGVILFSSVPDSGSESKWDGLTVIKGILRLESHLKAWREIIPDMARTGVGIAGDTVATRIRAIPAGLRNIIGFRSRK